MPSPRQIVVDDTDSRVVYSGGGWFQDNGSKDDIGNQGLAYKQTSHATKSDAALSFTFKGTSITLHGTYQPTGTLRWECFVDDISIGSNKPPDLAENHVNLCGKDGLQDGEHTLRVQVTTTKATFWVDSLHFTPSPQSSFDDTVLIVQDNDSAMSLDSNWEKLEDIASMTHVKGSKAKFEFVGKQLTWLGVFFFSDGMLSAPASGSFSVDGGPSTKFELNGASKDPTVNHYNQAFFTTPELQSGPHSITVTYDGADGPATPLTLDYLYVTTSAVREPSPSPGGNTPSPSSSSSTLTKSGASTLVGGSASATTSLGASSQISMAGATSINTNAPAISFISGVAITLSASSITSLTTAADTSQTGTIGSIQQQGSSPPTGAIVGGSVGGLALVALILLLLILARRRRKHQGINNQNQPCKVTPFTFAAPSASYSQSSSNDVDDATQSKEGYMHDLPQYSSIKAF